MDNIKCILYNEDKEQTLNYLKKTLRPFFTEEILQWQFSHPRSFLMIAKDKHNIIGTQSMLYHELYNGGNNHLIVTYKSETTYVSEEYRGKGIFETLYGTCMQKTKNNNGFFVWGFTGIPHVLKNKFNFHTDENIIHEGKITIGYNSKNLRNAKNIAAFIKNLILAKYNRLLKKFIPENFVLEITHHNKTADVLPSTINEINSNNSYIRLHFSNEFCEWRIDKNPVLNYKLLIMNHSGKKVGFVLYATKNNSMMISALHFSDKKFLTDIFHKILTEARKNQLYNIFYFGNINNPLNAEIFQTIKKFGGKVFSNKGMSFIIKSHTVEGETQYNNLHNWIINGLWTEGFTY